MTRKECIETMEYFIDMANAKLESKNFYKAMHYYEYANAVSRVYNMEHERQIFITEVGEPYKYYITKLNRFMDSVASILYESEELKSEY